MCRNCLTESFRMQSSRQNVIGAAFVSLAEAFHDPLRGREVFEIIRSLIQEVRIVPTGADVGASLLSAAATSRSFANPGSAGSRKLLVIPPSLPT